MTDPSGDRLTFLRYQREARKTADQGMIHTMPWLAHDGLKLAGEAGECTELIGKWLRGDFDQATLRHRIRAELGDVLWYLSDLCSEFDFTLEEVAELNLKKIADRQSRGVIKGDGDNR